MLNGILQRKSPKCRPKPASIHSMKTTVNLLGVSSQWDKSRLISSISLGLVYLFVLFWMTVILSRNNLNKQRNGLTHDFMDSKSAVAGKTQLTSSVHGGGNLRLRFFKIQHPESNEDKKQVSGETFHYQWLLSTSNVQHPKDPQPQKTAPVAGNEHLTTRDFRTKQ